MLLPKVLSDIKDYLAQEGWRMRLLAFNIACLAIFALPSSILNNSSLQPIHQNKSDHEVFGFAPYWTFDKLDNVNFNVLTTFAYFSITVNPDGNLDQYDQGYITFQSSSATEIFKKAHSYGTRVVLTLTQMDNYSIEQILDSKDAQRTVIEQAVDLVDKRGIDGINVDFEYAGDPGQDYRDKFSKFAADLTLAMHQRVRDSRVTVSMYAASAKDPKIYDVAKIAASTDGIFMMAYDFAVLGADNAMPTAPLYGHKEGKYWYDVSTAVSDFLTKMPANKLILGVPWYGYNYAVYAPYENAPTLPYYATTQTYSVAKDNGQPDMTGWDNAGKVGWRAYYDNYSGVWRFLFLDDVRSLREKIDFAHQKNLAGVGMWALGFDGGKSDFWNLLKEKFGTKLTDASIVQKGIKNYVN